MLQVNNISYAYTNNETVLQNINFQLNQGEHLCIMGESGCGKSTLLKAIYGLLDVEGTMFWKEEQILGPAHHLVPGMDFFKYVAQDFDLMPYITVAENIAKHLSRFYPEQLKQRTAELMEVIEMTAFANVKVKNLSGGQQQRVAIARALAKEPELLLLDEPFSHIDNFKKNSLRRKLFNYLKENNIACIVATHDGNDALSFADHMLIIRDNKIITSGNPIAIYNKPKNKYVASLFDDINEIKYKEKTFLRYPHQIKLDNIGTFKATVTNNYFKGTYWLIEVVFNNQNVFIKHDYSLDIGKEVKIVF